MRGNFNPCSKCGGYPEITVKGEHLTAVCPSCKYAITISHTLGFDFKSAFEELIRTWNKKAKAQEKKS